MSSEFFLCYEGEAPTKPEQDVEEIRATPGVRVLDDSFSTMVTVVAEDEAMLTRLLRNLCGWSVHPSVPFQIKRIPGLW